MSTALSDTTIDDPFSPAMLLGFTGPAGSGKESCAALLEEFGFRSIAFADALRLEIAQAFLVDLRRLTDRHTKEEPQAAFAIERCADVCFILAMVWAGEDLGMPRSARWLMQRWGTEYRLAKDRHYWTKQVSDTIFFWRASGWKRICITDVRTPAEADLVHALRGRLVQVHRDGAGAALAPDTAGHASEPEALAGIDLVVHNTGHLGHLRNELIRVLAPLPGPRAEHDRLGTRSGEPLDPPTPWPPAPRRTS